MKLFKQLRYAFMVLLLALFAGCGSSHHDDSNNKAYIYGELHGDMQDALLNNISFSEYDGKSSDQMIFIANTKETGIPDEIKDGVIATYQAGNIVALEHVNDDEINSLLRLLNIDGEYKLQDDEKDAALFAIEKRDGSNFFYVTVNDDDVDLDNFQRPEEMLCTTIDPSVEDNKAPEENNGEKSDEIASAHPNNIESILTQEEIDNTRINNFLNWIEAGEGRAAELKKDKKANFKSSDLAEIAEATQWQKDLSSVYGNMLISYTTYSVHSFNNKQDYYLITQSSQLNPSKIWVNKGAGKNCKTLALQYGQMRKYEFENTLNGNPGVVTPIISSSPQSANNTTSVSSSIGFNIGGSVGTSGVGLDGGISYSESTSFNVSDCTVTNTALSSDKVTTKWTYKFKDPDSGKRYFACSDLADAPALSRNLFSPVNRWIWTTSSTFRESVANPSITTKFSWTNGVSDGPQNAYWIEVFGPDHRNWESKSYDLYVPLSKPPLLVFNIKDLTISKNGKTESIKLLAGKDWRVECSESWCNIDEESGFATTSEGTYLHVTFDPNESGENRRATLRVDSKDGKDSQRLSITQSKY